MKRTAHLILLVSLMTTLGACGAPPDQPEPGDLAGGDELSTVSFALTAVPAGIHCVRFSATSGTRTSQQESTVTPGPGVLLTFSGLPPGPCSLLAEAFTQACSSVSLTTPPAWVSDAAMATLSAGETTPVNFTLRPAAGVSGSLDFVSLTLTPATKAFGGIAIGTSGAPFIFSIKNIGMTTSAVTLTVTGADAPSFLMTSSGCASLAAGAACTAQVTFHPTTVGAKAATLSATGTPGGVVTAALTGTGLTPAHLTITPSSFDFHVIFGSQTQSFTVTNTGGVAANGVGITLTPPAPGFMLNLGSCGGPSLPAFASCSLSVTYTQMGMDQTTNLTVASSNGGTAVAVLVGQH